MTLSEDDKNNYKKVLKNIIFIYYKIILLYVNKILKYKYFLYRNG